MTGDTEGKYEMGKRFAIVIGVAAAGVMAIGSQTATAAPDVVKYDTKVMILHESPHTDRGVLWHGGLRSEARKCTDGRQVILFRERRGPDRKLGYDRNRGGPFTWFSWRAWSPEYGRIYAKVRPKLGDGFVCRADRSRTVVDGEPNRGAAVTTAVGVRDERPTASRLLVDDVVDADLGSRRLRAASVNA